MMIHWASRWDSGVVERTFSAVSQGLQDRGRPSVGGFGGVRDPRRAWVRFRPDHSRRAAIGGWSILLSIIRFA